MSFDPILIRHQLHQIPELAFNEYKTKALIKSYLDSFGELKIIEFANSTALLAVYSHGEGEYQLFRADMDALPVEEETHCDFISQHAGMMHACGHDVHCAILLGLIQEVCISKPRVNALFLFQPAEEGKGGAEAVLAEGIIQSYPIKAAYALHVNPKLGLNQVSTKAGIFFAIPQEFDVDFIGKSAHAAFPEAGKDAMNGGIKFYQQIKAEIAELVHEEPLIFHVGKISSGAIRNIIADKCKLEGTHRTLSVARKKQLNQMIVDCANRVAKEEQLLCDVDFLCSYEPVVNDPELYERFVETCKNHSVDFIPSPIYMTGEDFGFFTTLYPGLLFWLGANDPDHDLHSGTLLPDDACITNGIKILYQLL